MNEDRFMETPRCFSQWAANLYDTIFGTTVFVTSRTDIVGLLVLGASVNESVVVPLWMPVSLLDAAYRQESFKTHWLASEERGLERNITAFEAFSLRYLEPRCPLVQPLGRTWFPDHFSTTSTAWLSCPEVLRQGLARLLGRVGCRAAARRTSEAYSRRPRRQPLHPQHGLAKPLDRLRLENSRNPVLSECSFVGFWGYRHETTRTLFTRRLCLRMATTAGAPLSGQGPMQQPKYALRERIELTALEQQIFALLLQVNAEYRLGSTLRVAGGWVRDKLLGLPQSETDLDIALDNTLGRTFAERLHQYLTERGEKQGYVHIIRVNPAQSKHLETARMRIFETWIDFVNLRKETYAAESRIPNMEIGTAAEDAYRRDLTINALFYNINTEQVEDWTQMGLRDLANGQIRTPLPPEITFLDDPLRVLRAVRFASRFGFTVVPDLIEAASVPQVQEALVKKVSRDRVGNELCQIFAGPRPAMALSLLYDMGLEACLFPLPNVFAVSDYPKGWTNRSVTQVARLERFGIYWQRHGIDMFPNECFRRIAVASACLSPLFPIEYVIKGEDVHSVVAYILGKGLRMNQQEKKTILTCLAASCTIARLVSAPLDWNDRAQRIQVGQVIRSLGPWWELALLIQLALDERLRELEPTSLLDGNHQTPLTDTEETIAREYLSFREQIKTQGLDRAWELRPLLDGHAVRRLLPALPVGPLVGEVMERQIQEQLANPALTDTECAQRLQQLYASYTKTHGAR